MNMFYCVTAKTSPGDDVSSTQADDMARISPTSCNTTTAAGTTSAEKYEQKHDDKAADMQARQA